VSDFCYFEHLSGFIIFLESVGINQISDSRKDEWNVRGDNVGVSVAGCVNSQVKLFGVTHACFSFWF
jgi:hypothetical protein